MNSTTAPSPTNDEIKDLLIKLFAKLDRMETDLKARMDKIETDTRTTNEKIEKWDGHLWALTLGLIGTAWAAILAATVVVVVRTLAG